MFTASSLQRTIMSIAFAWLIHCNAIANEIWVGQINAQSGGGASLGVPLSQGAQIYFDSVNAKGGIKGSKIRLLTLDDQFKEQQTLDLAQKLLLEKPIVAIINTVGAPNIDNLISSGFLDKHRLPVLGPLTNSTTARDRKSPYVFFVRAGLREEISAMVKQIEILGFKRVGIFFQNDTSGLDGLGLIRNALAIKGIQPVAVASYERKDFKADSANEIFQRAKPDVILTISVAAATADLVRKTGRSISSGSMIIANSGNSAEVVIKDLGVELARGLAIVQVTPSVSSAALPLVKEFLSHFANYATPGTKANAFHLEGYITAKILYQALSQINGKIDRETLLASLSSLQRMDLGGYAVNFSAGNRLGSAYAEVAVITGSGKLSR
jgi:branched-chain amino acid transport system substrate-binding protein